MQWIWEALCTVMGGCALLFMALTIVAGIISGVELARDAARSFRKK